MFGLLLLVDFIPFFPLILLAVYASKFNNIINEKSVVYKTKIEFKNLRDFFPKNVKRSLEKNNKIKKCIVKKVASAYKNLFIIIVIYFVFWLAYIIEIIFQIVMIITGGYSDLQSIEFGYVLGSVLMSILVLYWLLLTPIFEYFNLKKLSEMSYKSWEFFHVVTSKFVKWSSIIFKYGVEFFVSLILVAIYLDFVKKLLAYFNVQMIFWIAFSILMLYHYLVLRLLSWIIKKSLIRVLLINEGWTLFKRYIKGDVIYLILKNATYFSMVVIYAYSVEKNQTDLPIAGALGVLFLFDTFIMQEKEIHKKLEEEENNLGVY